MSLKKWYFSLENKYYEFVEKTGLYKFTDKIDKFMPSMLFFILLFIIVIAGLFLLIPGSSSKGYNEVYFTIKSVDGEILTGVSMDVVTGEDNFNITSNDEGETSKVKIPKDSKFSVDLDYTIAGYSYFSEEYFSETNDHINIFLETVEEPTQKVNYTFSLVDENNRGVNEGTAYFSCSNEGAIAPNSVEVDNGVVNVQAEAACSLLATISSPGYQTIYSTPITSGIPFVTLESNNVTFSDLYTIDVYTKDNTGSSISNIKVTAYNQGIPITSCLSSSDGYCKLEGLETANYELKAVDQRSIPEFGTTQENVYVNNNIVQTMTLSREVSGYIKVQVNDHRNQPLEGALVYLKILDQTLADGYTNENGIKLFTVTDNSPDYRIVVDVEGYLIEAKTTSALSSNPVNPNVVFNLTQVTSSTYSSLVIKVIGEDGKPYSNAKVVLFDSETGFLTDFAPKISNYNGEVIFGIPTGDYYAQAIKGSSVGQSTDFSFDARLSSTMEDVIIPMTISKGYLTVNVTNDDGVAVPNAKVDIYDRYDATRAIRSDLTDALGQMTIELDADEDYYARVSDPLGSLGSTQSEYVRILTEDVSNLNVTLYNVRNPITKPELVFNGLYSGTKRMAADLKAGREYQAKFTLFIPDNREGNNRFRHIGAIISTGNKIYLEQESLYIKEADVSGAPNVLSVKKYAAYEKNQDYLDLDDFESETYDEAKWVSIIFDEDDYEYNTAYEIVLDVKIKDEAAFGEELKVNYLGYGYNRSREYEVLFRDGEDEIDELLLENLNQSTFTIGDELACDDSFCFNMIIVNENEDLRSSVLSDYTASPGVDYTATFTLINNSEENIFTNSRLQIKNIDEGIDFENIKITEHNGHTININPDDRDYDFDEEIELLDSKRSIRGEIKFNPVLKGDRHLVINFISDQEVIFSRNIILHVLSDKTFDVSVTPNLLPAYKDNLSLQVEVKDSKTGYAIDDTVNVILKNKYLQNIGNYKEVGLNGEVSMPIYNALSEDDVVFVYIQAPEYETHVEEIKVTDEIFNITPSNLGVSLNVNTKKSETILFNINNLTQNDILIKSIEIKGERNDLDIVDAVKINNSLSVYNGVEIKGVNPDEITNNYDVSKEIELKISTNPKAESISEVQNIRAYLVISVQDKTQEDLFWTIDIPVSITVGFDGIMDDASCLVLSETYWEEVVLDGSSTKQFLFNNGCTINSKPVILSDGLSAKVEFESNPLGKFSVNVGNRLVELSHGYFKDIFDAVDREKQYPVVLKYTPVGRYTGDITGKIIFKSVNETINGPQELISEFKFNLHVISLEDCYVLSKEILEIRDRTNADSFTIENKGCGQATTYRLSCDDCAGLDVQPYANIKVDATGSSGDIVVKSSDAVPGIYLLNLYSKVDGQRGSEKNVGKLRVIVRPFDKCLDLDRYEFNLYRNTISENTGQVLNATSYDTTNLVNYCYKQNVNVEGKVKNSSRWTAALGTGLRDFASTFALSGIFQWMSTLDLGKAGVFFGGLNSLKDKDETPKEETPEDETPEDNNPGTIAEVVAKAEADAKAKAEADAKAKAEADAKAEAEAAEALKIAEENCDIKNGYTWIDNECKKLIDFGN